MKPCAKYRKQIAWLAVGALGSPAARNLQAHLVTCVGCRRFLRSMSQLTKTLAARKRLPRVQPSETFHRRVAEALRSEVVKPRRDIWVNQFAAMLLNWRVAVPAVATVVVALVVVLVAFGHHVLPASQTGRVAVSAAPEPDGALNPSVANYTLAANRSFEAFGALLTRQARQSRPETPIYTASTRSLEQAENWSGSRVVKR